MIALLSKVFCKRVIGPMNWLLLITLVLFAATVLLLPADLQSDNNLMPNPSLTSITAAALLVSNTNDAGAGSLRQALLDANANAGPDSIRFAIPMSDSRFDVIAGVWTIRPSSALPTIADNGTVLNGLSQSTFAGDLNPDGPEILIDGSAIESQESGCKITSSNNVISGLVIVGFKAYGLRIDGINAKNNWIWGNYIGTNVAGTDTLPNGSGVLIADHATNNIIGGDALLLGNLISGNKDRGCDVRTDNNSVIGNRIGTNRAGTAALGRQNVGVFIGDRAKENQIGGATVGERNIISGNGGGVRIEGEGTSHNRVLGNFIGTDISGASVIANNSDGIMVFMGSDNAVGGLSPGEANLISGNGRAGVSIGGLGADSNQVLGNLIGTDAGGKFALANGFGLTVANGAKHNEIGPANIVSGNLEHGIYIDGVGTDSNTVRGNWVGLDIAGQDTLPNLKNGVLISNGARYNSIGGQSTEDGNVAAGNGFSGLVVQGDSTGYNVFQNNYSGTDVSGTTALGNRQHGALSLAGLFNKFSKNLFSGNGDYGITLKGVTRDCVVMDNKIGVKADGTTPLSNTFSGVLVAENASDCTIGPNNKIWFNPAFGIHLLDSTVTRITITQNSIKNNHEGGIRLTNGANDGMQAPVIITASPLSGTAVPNSLIEVFSDSAGQGSVYEGEIKADGSGNWTWTNPVSGPNVTITATDQAGNTSEFSNSVVSGVGENNVAENPTRFYLAQNYPNPFNPATTIEYQLPHDTQVSLRIFNITGELVKCLKEEKQSAGYHKMQWDGRDENGNSVAGGLYLYHLKADGFSHSNKMVLIR